MGLIDTSNMKAPPASRGTKNAPASRSRMTKAEKRQEGVEGLLQIAGVGCMMAGWHADAGAINKYGPTLSVEIVKLGEMNESIGKGLDFLTQTGPYAGLVAVVLPFALQIAANHNYVKAEMLSGAGVVKPETLAVSVQTDLAKMHAEALKEHRNSLEELAMIQAQHEETEQRLQAMARETREEAKVG